MDFQQDAISKVLNALHIGKREVYEAFSGTSYANRPGGHEADPAKITPENFDRLHSVVLKARTGYLGRNNPWYYGRTLDVMAAAYERDDIADFKEAADELLSKIVNE
jgi:hypothetical protein